MLAVAAGALFAFGTAPAVSVSRVLHFLRPKSERAEKKRQRIVYAHAIPPRSVGRLHRHFAVCRRDSGDAALSAAQAGRSRKFLPPFSLGSANAHSLHRLRCRRPPHILRRQQPHSATAPQRPVEYPRTRDFNLRHVGGGW